jgi:tetratricopeptide (TPR) repeat protein
MMPEPLRKIALLAICATLCGCATTSGTRPASELFMEPLHIGLKPDTELGLTDFDAATLFREGVHLHQAGRCDKALVFYGRLLEEFSTSRYLSSTAFNAGRCLEELGKNDEAVARYRIVTAALPRSKDWLDAAFRQSMVLASLERHREAGELLERVLVREGLSVSDRVDALVMHGENQEAMGEILLAEKSYRRALRLHHQYQREEYLDPAAAARAEFRLSGLAEKRFMAAPLRLPEEQMQLDLEAKARLLLETQSGYLRTIRHGDPEWATAAGYRVGNLYLHLHRAMQEAPVPEGLSEEETRVYADLLRKRTAVLLRKALRLFEMTLQLAERTRSENDYTKAAREEMARVEAQVLSLYEDIQPEEEEP